MCYVHLLDFLFMKIYVQLYSLVIFVIHIITMVLCGHQDMRRLCRKLMLIKRSAYKGRETVNGTAKPNS